MPFTTGALFADDAPPNGRYDRYSNEYARYVWDAAEQANRPDILATLRPSLTTQMKLWWDLVDGDDGYGYPWGRSLGVVSYMDTLEIVAFLAQHPEFRPAPLADLVSQYARAWNYLRHDFKDDRHLLSLFDFGRGNFAYISIDREWQQTTGFLGKVQIANAGLAPVLEREKLTAYPARPSLPNVARFQFFREQGDRVAGVWVVRQSPSMRFALPITTGTRPGVADYLPAPHGLPGFAVPVEQNVPALVPYLELPRTAARSSPPTAPTRSSRPRTAAVCAHAGLSGPSSAVRPASGSTRDCRATWSGRWRATRSCGPSGSRRPAASAEALARDRAIDRQPLDHLHAERRANRHHRRRRRPIHGVGAAHRLAVDVDAARDGQHRERSRSARRHPTAHRDRLARPRTRTGRPAIVDTTAFVEDTMTLQQIAKDTCIVRNTAGKKGRTTAVAPGTAASRYLHYGRIILDPGDAPLSFATEQMETGLIGLKGSSRSKGRRPDLHHRPVRLAVRAA